MAPFTRLPSAKLMNTSDCAGMLENGKCRWLQIDACAGENCTYYRKASSQAKAEARLCSLDEETQESIAKKYYGGFRPWQEDNEKPQRQN